MARNYARAGTSWVSVFGGWFAALGALLLFLPLAAVMIGTSPVAQARTDDPTLAIPVILALFFSFLIGGNVAGRMALVRRSWHGFMTGIWGLFVSLVMVLVGGGTGGTFGGLFTLPRLDIDMATFGNVITFGAILGFAAVLVGAWLGGAFAPRVMLAEPGSRPTVERGPAPEPVREREPVSRRPTLFDRILGTDRRRHRGA